MSNYPDGCTQADHDAYWGGPERPDSEDHDHQWQGFGIPCECGADKCTIPFCDTAQPKSWPGHIQSDIAGLCRECALARLVRDMDLSLRRGDGEPERIEETGLDLLYLEIVALREWDGRELNEYLEAA